MLTYSLKKSYKSSKKNVDKFLYSFEACLIIPNKLYFIYISYSESVSRFNAFKKFLLNLSGFISLEVLSISDKELNK